ncbi:MAG TPA: glutamate mutase L [Candidatus Pelethocola excrementipullorum]|nr:glutamate mutase L [Candidatus Pelethocola excrementipullorum]
MKAVLLIDFGSTYTKITAVDLDTCDLLGTAASYTTVESDINHGLAHALEILERKIGHVDFAETYACSSAAGGLKMISIGLVPELTVQAAKEASLGAGAKIMKTYSYQITKSDIREINELEPDIILLSGGTDGGNSETILHNAKKLREVTWDAPIIIAGNRSCVDECEEILQEKQVFVCENVMPELGKLNILPTQELIREIFLKKIVQGKGLTEAKDLVSDIIMPTPSAMLTAMELLADGCEGESGIGNLIGVDLGGATTDIYSIADGSPTGANTIFKGIQEPYAKRTVEGDIGMRYSIGGILEAGGVQEIAKRAGLSVEKVNQMVKHLNDHKDLIPEDMEYESLDYGLAAMAVETAVHRHAGTIEQVYTPMGEAYLQTGKDLRSVENVIVTGGALIHAREVTKIASYALYRKEHPEALLPEKANIWVDDKYILASMGLLSKVYPKAALDIMKREITNYGN